MKNENETPVCGSCGSDEVTIASSCEWNSKLQQWVASDPDYNGAHCPKCSAEGTIRFINRSKLDELFTRMQIVIPLSRGEVLLLPADANDLHKYASNIYLDAAQEEFLDRAPLNDRYDREIVITDVERSKDYFHVDPKSVEIDGRNSWGQECLRLTVECTLTDSGGE